MSLMCWYCGKSHFKNRQALYRHWGWCEKYRRYKETGLLPHEFELRKQTYIQQQEKHPMPRYLKKYPVEII